MTTGLKIVNASNTVSIDENYKNYRFVASGQSMIRGYYSATSVQFNGNRPLIAIRPTKANGSYIGMSSISNYNGTYTGNFFCVSETDVVFDWFVFDMLPDAVGNPGYVQVRDGAGRLTFDSNQRYMRVIGFNEAPRPDRREALTILTPGTSQLGFPGYLYQYASAAIWDGDRLYCEEIQTAYQDTSDYGTNYAQNASWSYPRESLLLDVTGY